MMRSQRILITIICIIIFTLFYENFSFYAQKDFKREKSIATNIIDGDTIVVSGGERIRLLGIDSPEKGEFYYSNAKKKLEALIENKEVELEKGEGDDKDKYGRLLRYIFLNGTNINLKLVEGGYAICYFYEPSVYKESCKQLEENALTNKIGRWQNATN
ncbi:MAG: thermonuclease family protein [archaeon]